MTQREMVRWHLENIGELDPMTALREYGIMRLSARISELKDEGMNIETEYRTVRNRFGKLVAHAVYKVAA